MDSKCKRMTLTFGSLFAGIGGFDLGFERSGMECRWQVEKDRFCLKVLDKHWPDVAKYEDVREFADALEKANKRTGGAIRGYVPTRTQPSANSNSDGSDSPINLETSEKQSRDAYPAPLWTQQSLLSWGNKGSGFGPEQNREGVTERRFDTAEPLREVPTRTAPVQGRPNSNPSAPPRLQQADGSNVALSEVPPQHSQGYDKCLKEMLRNPQAFRVDLICGGFP